MPIYKSVVAIVTGIVVYVLPELAFVFACYKYKMRNQELPEAKIKAIWKIACAGFGILYSGAVLWFVPLWQALFCIVFMYFAIFGFVLDGLIRIVANEMLLVLLPIGLAYRVLSGGFVFLLGSLEGLGVVIAVFGTAAAFTRLKKGSGGVGMGDVKLAMVIAITVGWPGSVYFLGGMAIAIGAYCLVGLKTYMLRMDSTFPMCGHIMAGFLTALLLPYLPGLVV